MKTTTRREALKLLAGAALACAGAAPLLQRKPQVLTFGPHNPVKGQTFTNVHQVILQNDCQVTHCTFQFTRDGSAGAALVDGNRFARGNFSYNHIIGHSSAHPFV